MKRLLIGLIRLYQKGISAHTAPSCRFTPTCSAYAITAIERFGAVRGLGLALWRILRCNPLCRGGYDPVPEKKSKRKKNDVSATADRIEDADENRKDSACGQ